MVGMLAKSKAGHDKENIYVIFQEDDAYVYLVDGKIRTTDKPKKKNKSKRMTYEEMFGHTWMGYGFSY